MITIKTGHNRKEELKRGLYFNLTVAENLKPVLCRLSPESPSM